MFWLSYICFKINNFLLVEVKNKEFIYYERNPTLSLQVIYFCLKVIKINKNSTSTCSVQNII